MKKGTVRIIPNMSHDNTPPPLPSIEDLNIGSNEPLNQQRNWTSIVLGCLSTLLVIGFVVLFVYGFFWFLAWIGNPVLTAFGMETLTINNWCRLFFLVNIFLSPVYLFSSRVMIKSKGNE